MIDKGLLAAGAAIGGLGLFLLAVRMISEGVKVAAGPNLRTILGQWTRSPLRGVGSGILITALVQSSSAVTVATIGFVNAGILGLNQALGVVFGANVGTTMTGWLVAAVGFKIKVDAFALPMIGIGMLLQLTGPGQRRGALGEALAGFGLFFIGIEVLAGAFEVIAGSLDPTSLSGGGMLGMLAFMGAGFLMTVLTQSSSAAIAMILTAATGGLVTLAAAAAMVVGANVGTTSTAALAVIGATPNAKRVAAAHIIFNLITGGVALLMLPVLLWFVVASGQYLGLGDLPAVSLALFHTVFNVLGVALMLPLAVRLAAFLQSRFRTTEEIEGRPQYLDQTVAVTPSLAVNALAMELGRMGTIARRVCREALSVESSIGRHIPADVQVVENLGLAVGSFVVRIQRDKLSPELSGELPTVLRASRYFVSAAEHAGVVARQQVNLSAAPDSEADTLLAVYRTGVAAMLEIADIERSDFSVARCEERMVALHEIYDKVKGDLLKTAAQGGIDVMVLTESLENLSQMQRMVQQLMKGVRHLTRLYPHSSAAVTADTAEQPVDVALATPSDDS